jgi:hypothetical protein
MSLTYQTKVVQVFERLLDEEIEHLKEALSSGSINSLDGYTKVAGKIAGLRSAKELIEEAVAICDGKTETREQNT